MNLFLLFLLMLKASVFSTSGLGNLPILYDDLIARGWATEQQFAESVAVGQVSPGPSGLWVISLGYLMAGLPGALLATVAICLPPLGVLLVDRLHSQFGNHAATRGFVRGLGLTVVGIFLVVLARLMIDNGIDGYALLIAVASLALALTRRLPVIAILVLAALAGLLIYR